MQPPPRRATQLAAQPHAVSKVNTFVVLTNADLATLSPDDTIRVPPIAHSRPSFPSPLLSQKKDLPATDAPSRYRDGNRSRSPIKGLFPTGTNHIPDLVQSFTQEPLNDVSEYDKTGGLGAVNNAHQTGVIRGRVRTLVPPGLTPAPMYSASLPDDSSASSSFNPAFVPKDFHNNTSLLSKTASRNNTISSQRHSDSIFPLPHRDAPSPPSELISLPPGSSLIHSTPHSGSNTEIDTLGAFPRPPRTNHHHSPRTRLRSLLQDDCRTSIPRVSVMKPPPSPSPLTTTASNTPTPMELSAIITSIQGSLYDDDETPRASPVDGGQGSPSISWIQELAA